MHFCEECGQPATLITHFYDNGIECPTCKAWYCPSCAVSLDHIDDTCAYCEKDGFSL